MGHSNALHTVGAIFCPDGALDIVCLTLPTDNSPGAFRKVWKARWTITCNREKALETFFVMWSKPEESVSSTKASVALEHLERSGRPIGQAPVISRKRRKPLGNMKESQGIR